jgi:cytochrome c553
MKMDYCKIKRKSVWSNALALLIAGAVLMMAPVSAWAIHLGASGGHGGSVTYKTEDVRNTLHNLSGAGTSFNNPNIDSDTGGVQEVCVFCHTPHGGRTDTSDGTPPLWNRADPSTTGYSMYSSVTFDGTATAPLGVSLACLSCHDGVMAMDALINYSGSGGFLGTSNTSRFQQLLDETPAFVDPDGSMAENDRGILGEPNYATLTGGSPFPNLAGSAGGVALTDDHPISIKICVDGTGSAFNDDQFDDVCNGSPATGSNKVTPLAKVADTDLNTLPTKVRDRIRAYPSDNALNSRFVECASCHNPHAPRPLFLRLPSVNDGGAITANTARSSTWGQGGPKLNPAFAVWGDNPNSGSAVCLTCHEK